jgi:hypothetical protein
VLWQAINWGDGYRSYCARVASVRSVGPGAVPKGFQVRILADAALVRSVSLTEARTLASKVVSGTTREISLGRAEGLLWTSKAALPAGEQLQLNLTVVTRSPAGALEIIKHPVVEVLGPEEHRRTQRTTYLETVTRQDSVYDAESKRHYA